jgi:hypothetical protein
MKATRISSWQQRQRQVRDVTTLLSPVRRCPQGMPRAFSLLALAFAILCAAPVSVLAQDVTAQPRPSLADQLCFAVQASALEEVRRLLASGAPVDGPCGRDEKESPLHVAIYVESRDSWFQGSLAPKVTDTLLAHGGVLDKLGRNRETPLELALAVDHAERVVRILRARGARGRDPIHVFGGFPVAMGLGFPSKGENGLDLAARPDLMVTKKNARVGLRAYGELGMHTGKDMVLGAGLGLHLAKDRSLAFWSPTLGGYAHKSAAGRWGSGVTGGLRYAWMVLAVRVDARVALQGEREHSVVLALELDPLVLVINVIKVLSIPSR